MFDPGRRPWIRADLADPETISEVVRRCPTGALHYRLAVGDPEQPTTPTTIRRDPAGPLVVRGDLVVDTPHGALHETRAALCACGNTKLDPFCDGACGVNDGRTAGTRGDGHETLTGRRRFRAECRAGRPPYLGSKTEPKRVGSCGRRTSRGVYFPCVMRWTT